MEGSQLLDENNLKNWHVHFLLQDSSCSISSMKFEVPWTRWNKSVWSNVHDATGLKAFFLVAINWAMNGWCFFPSGEDLFHTEGQQGHIIFKAKCRCLSIGRYVCCLMCATMIFHVTMIANQVLEPKRHKLKKKEPNKSPWNHSFPYHLKVYMSKFSIFRILGTWNAFLPPEGTLSWSASVPRSTKHKYLLHIALTNQTKPKNGNS